MKKDIKNQKEPVEASAPDSVWDRFQNGKLESRSVIKGDVEFSMRYALDMGVFFGDVVIDGKAVYRSTEDVCEKLANLPYPELNALRDLLWKEWQEEIKKFLAQKKNTPKA